MATPVIIDIVILAVLVGFLVYGARRGLFRALAGLLIIVVALVGAGMIASAASGPAARLITPMISQRIEEKVDLAMSEQSDQVQMPEEDVEESADGFSVEGILALMGLDSDVRGSLAQQAEDKIKETGISLAQAIVESVAQSILYAVIYILAFILLLILLRLLARALDLVLKLPGLNLLNTLGGAVAGLIQGALLLFLAIWLARRFGVSFETPTVESTHILHFFTTNTPLSVLSFLE